MTTQDETKTSTKTDQEFSEESVEAVRAEPQDPDADADAAYAYDEPSAMTIGIRTDDVKAQRDVVFGDKIDISAVLSHPDAGREPAPLTVSRKVLEDLRHTFVPPRGFEELSFKERLLLARVPAGCGGGSAAIRLLLDAGAVAIRELPPDVALRRFSDGQIEVRSGYLLRNATATSLKELTEFEITRLCEDLGKRDSWLVLTVDPRVRFPQDLLWRYTVDIGEPPSARDVLEAHLRHHLSGQDPEGRRATEILCDAAVVEMLNDSADREDRVARAASFARILADAEMVGDFDLTKIRGQHKRITDASFEAWFDGLDFDNRCFAIALAALPGYSFEIVSTAASDLAGALRPPVAPAPGSVPEDPFRVRRSQRLDTVLARVSTRPVSTRYGQTPMEVVAFIDPSLAEQILRRVWTEHAETRPIVLNWLRGLARHGVQAVRHGAARAVGVLAVHAFDYVRRNVIGPWAQSEDSRDRQAAALALLAPARDPSLSIVSRRMLYDWHLDRSSPALRNTAARAYGQVGLVEIDEALDGLAHLATDDGGDLVQVIANSVTSLIVRGDEDMALRVLRRLLSWSGCPTIEPPEGSWRASRGMSLPEQLADQRCRMFVAYYTFLTVAVDAVLVAPVDDRPDAVAWHGLLWRADNSEQIAEVVSGLWGKAIESSISHDAARDALTAWAVRIDGDSLGRAAFGRLLALSTAHDTDRPRNTVLSLIRSWKSGREPLAPRAADAVAVALAVDGEGNGTA